MCKGGGEDDTAIRRKVGLEDSLIIIRYSREVYTAEMRNYYMSQLRGWTSRRAHWRHVIESGEGKKKEYTHPAQDIQVSSHMLYTRKRDPPGIAGRRKNTKGRKTDNNGRSRHNKK